MKAHEVINSPEKWTQEYCYRDKDGQPCSKEEAVCYCTLGALETAYGEGWSEQERKLSVYLNNQGFWYASVWNDLSTYETVYNTLKELDI